MRSKGVLAFALLLACCGAPRSFSYRPDSEGSARQYMRLAVALGERDPDALDYYYGPPDWVADIRAKPPTLMQIAKSAEDVLAEVSSQSQGGNNQVRAQFLARQLRAIIARTDLLLGAHRTFDEESEVFFGFRAGPANAAAPSQIRQRLASRLPAGKRLVDRFNVFDSQFLIPSERLADVMTQALEACREQTLAHMTLPPGEQVRLEFVRNKPWSAYSYYRGNYQSVIQVNADLPLTVDRALTLACHEGYPGHHVFNSLTDQLLVRGLKRIELAVQPTFSPQSFVSEAIASAAPEIAFTGAEKVRLEKDVLFPLAGIHHTRVEEYIETEGLVDALHPEELSIARDFIDEKLEFVRAEYALEERALMAHPEATLRYLNEFRSYVITYTAGRDVMSKWIHGQAAEADKWAGLRQLVSRQESFRPN